MTGLVPFDRGGPLFEAKPPLKLPRDGNGECRLVAGSLPLQQATQRTPHWTQAELVVVATS
jgi:hypothetical protein